MKAKNILLFLLAAALMASCEREDMTSPVAMFHPQTPPRYMFKINLDASESFPAKKTDWLEYRWDINGDHLEWETEWLGNPVVTVQFPFVYTGYVGLQVKDSNGNITELYQALYANNRYRILDAWSDLEIDFRKIDYLLSYPDRQHTWTWAYDNILLPDSEQWYNYSTSAERAEYGTLMPWNVADTLDKHYRLPSKADWQEMIDYCGGAALAGFNLQVRVEHGLQLTLPGLVTIEFPYNKGKEGYYWTGDEVDEESAWDLKISADSDEAKFVILDKSSLASVRLMTELFQ